MTYPFCTLLILDGWGDAPAGRYNAIKLARTANLDYLYAHSYNTLLEASGESVGLSAGVMGNSEVGHMNIGAGRVVIQPVLRIQQEIANGKFFENIPFLEAIQHAKTHNSSLHLIGLVSDGLVHSSLEHLIALIKLCADQGFSDKVYIHAITDGRDSDINASQNFIARIEDACKLYHTGRIATILGDTMLWIEMVGGIGLRLPMKHSPTALQIFPLWKVPMKAFKNPMKWISLMNLCFLLR